MRSGRVRTTSWRVPGQAAALEPRAPAKGVRQLCARGAPLGRSVPDVPAPTSQVEAIVSAFPRCT
jgi:hypothetical protein